MKRLITSIFCLFSLSIFSFANGPIECTNNIDLCAGTQVVLETGTRLNSRTATVGQLIKCKVKTNVVVDGQIVVRTGATALARISKIQDYTYNEAESISIVPISVQAVDGQQLALHGGEQTIKGQFPNQHMELLPHTLLLGSIMNNYTISI